MPSPADAMTAGAASGGRRDTGLDAGNRRKVSDHLADVLADVYTLLLKTHVYHWNVVGPLFVPIHELTEKHYNDLFEAADVIAERIRALGHPAPLSFGALLSKTALEEETVRRTAADMVEHLAEDHEMLVRRLREAALAADEVDDLVTADLLTQRMAFHEKAIWMLRSIVAR
ncbi:MAG: DNA starvation/stationary phase protection protein [Hyphomicrobiaceae bacterium]|nr:DNA starvation/stationary phase protection protein [Hyphomicrobiaceae bacterium]